MGVGTLIMFVAMILTVAIAGGVFIQSTGSLQGQALLTGKLAEDQVSTGFQTVEIAVQKDENNEYTYLTTILKLNPGSSPIKLDNLLITQDLTDTTASLIYRGTNGTIDKSATGYLTASNQEVGAIGIYHENEGEDITSTWQNIGMMDFDLDGTRDQIKLCPPSGGNICPDGSKNTGNYIAINISSTSQIIYIQITNSTGGPIDDLCQTDVGNFQADLTLAPVGSYGFLTLTGSLCEHCCQIENSQPAITLEYFHPKTPLTGNLDQDSDSNDYLTINTTHANLYFTSNQNYTLLFNNPISAPAVLSASQTLSTLGTIEISGTTTSSYVIDEGISFTIKPLNQQNYYVAEHIQEGVNHRNGTISRGDLVKLHLQTPRALIANENVRITLAPGTGNPTRHDIYTDSVMAKDIIPLYP